MHVTKEELDEDTSYTSYDSELDTKSTEHGLSMSSEKFLSKKYGEFTRICVNFKELAMVTCADGKKYLINYPKEIKAFYMKQNDDGKTVRAMDVLFPQIGEIIGGSEREADFGKLCARVDELGMSRKELWWYLDTRRWGSAPHSGFGLGFERLLLFVTGMGNIRDVIPFPRTPKNAEF